MGMAWLPAGQRKLPGYAARHEAWFKAAPPTTRPSRPRRASPLLVRRMPVKEASGMEEQFITLHTEQEPYCRFATSTVSDSV
jgi:hypothetical protein